MFVCKIKTEHTFANTENGKVCDIMVHSCYRSSPVHFAANISARIVDNRYRRIDERGHMRLYLVLCLSVLLSAVALLSVSLLAGGMVDHHQGIFAAGRVVSYVVEPGDTLWGIAKSDSTNGEIFKTLAEIEQINRVSDNGDIYPGQILRIPSD